MARPYICNGWKDSMNWISKFKSKLMCDLILQMTGPHLQWQGEPNSTTVATAVQAADMELW